MQRRQKLTSFTLGASLLVTFFASNVAAQAQNVAFNTKNIVKRGYSRLFTYDPQNSGTVSVSYVNKFSRLAALLNQPHTVTKTACGYFFQGMQGLPLSTATYKIDISTDTIVSNKANLILVGVDSRGVARIHQAIGLNFDSKTSSAPGWDTYSYSAQKFSPVIASDETFSSLAISLLGGTTINPDHTAHWLSHPVINGINIHELVNDTVSITDGRLVGF